MRWIGCGVLGVVVFLLGPSLGTAAPPDDGTPGIIVEQNLFHPSRSVPPPPPPPVVAAPKPAPPPPPPKFELSGVVTIDGEPSMALVQEPQLTQGKSMTVKLGDALGAYKLVAVEADRVRFEGTAGTVTVLLHDPAKKPKTVAAVPPTPALRAPQAGGAPPPAAQNALRGARSRGSRFGAAAFMRPGSAARGPSVPPPADEAGEPSVAPPGDDESDFSGAPPLPTDPNEPARPESIMNVFQKAFGALTGQDRFPISRGRVQPGQGQGQ